MNAHARPPHIEPSVRHLIPAVGAMADRIRAHAWSSTALGPIQGWSDTLLACINLILSSPISIAIFWGPRYTLLYNDAYRPFIPNHHSNPDAEALGCSGEEVWKDIWTTLGPEYDAVFHRGESFREHNILLPHAINGTLQNFTLTPIYNRGAVVGVLSEAAESPLQDDECARVQATLRTSEERIRQILASTRDCIKVLDLDGNILSMNDEGLARLGIADISVVEHLPWLSFWRVNNRQSAEQALRTARFGGVGTCEGSYITPTGEETWWENTITPIRNDNFANSADESSNISQLLVVSREITRKKLTEDALLKSERLAALGRLASSIAHEINNPLEAVTNLLYLANHSDELPQIHEFLSIAEREIRRVSVIANQTLRFHKQTKDPRAVTCDELLETVLSIYHGRILSHRVRVERRRSTSQKIVCFDGEIRQILNNLVSNAVDSMSAHGGRLILSSQSATDWKTGESGVRITVADTGSGMSRETRNHIFEAFFTTKGLGGAGLGLWLSKEIIDRDGGRLNVRSNQGPDCNGTVFTLFLPLTPPTPQTKNN
ncbi:two-component system sensor histidine kinase NtrB [Acidicapsa ligni]|uniref:two-component system sensor histidine kinase NtrB n=1 Tax=Acidicapsa ligni TaxID=542300 RepID=UPI0021DFCCF4|nr:ATP-binding protein [Acidicapsa ligni]